MNKFKDYLTESKSVCDQLSSGKKISKDDFTSYRNAMAEAYEFNKRFDKFVSDVRRNKIYNEKELKVLEEANKLLKFQGKIPISIAKDQVK